VSELEANDLDLLGNKCVNETDPSAKGKILERFFESVVQLDNDFEIVKKHSRIETGELDYVLRQNIPNDNFWSQSHHIVVECKNWKEPIEPSQLDHFLALVRTSGPLCCMGLYVTVSPLTEGAWTAIRDARLKDGIITIVIEPDFFSALSLGLKSILPRLYEKQVFRA
jgi:hypothetical protein